jgi:hypothetical protein
MRCLSLWQPWASLIAARVKFHETRSWPAPSVIIGKRIAIHASKTDKGLLLIDRELRGVIDRACRCDPWDLPRGVIVATAVVESSRPTEQFHTDEITQDDFTAGDWSFGRYAWRLTDIRPVEPIPLRGHQGIFFLPGDVVLALGKLGAA